MKSILRILSLVILLPVGALAQIDFNKMSNEVKSALNGKKPVSNEDAISGLKEALTVGSNNAAASASKADGYFKNPAIKIPFPPEAAQMEKELRAIGMGAKVDEFVLTMNRAAEEAAKSSAPIFVGAVKNMNITDGLSILRGSDTAATGYLRKSTSGQLHDNFKPSIQAATQKVEVTKYWKPLVSTYNKIPFVKKMNPDLDEYITGRALGGLFVLVAQEETKIRTDPAAQVTDLLKKVFGGQ